MVSFDQLHHAVSSSQLVNMSFNLTAAGFDPEIFFVINSALSTILASTLIIPTIVLHLTFLVILVLAKAIKWQIKVILINIIAAEIIAEIGVLVNLVGYFPRAILNDGKFSCNFSTSSYAVSLQSNLAAVAFYSVAVYLYIKDGVKKIKWYVIITYISISWVVHISLGILILTEVISFPTEINEGLCNTLFSSGSSLGTVYTVITTIELIVCLSVTLTFCILTHCYIKRNIIQEDTEIKRAVARTMIYQSIKIFLIVMTYVASIAVVLDYNSYFGGFVGTILYFIGYYLIDIIFKIVALSGPIASFFSLKPLRDAAKQVCPCCKQNDAEPQTVQPQIIQLQLRPQAVQPQPQAVEPQAVQPQLQAIEPQAVQPQPQDVEPQAVQPQPQAIEPQAVQLQQQDLSQAVQPWKAVRPTSASCPTSAVRSAARRPTSLS